MKRQTSQNGIIFPQETYTTKRDETVWTNQFGCGTNSITFSHGKSDARGVLIAFREEMKYKIVSKHIDNDGRYIILNVLIDNNHIGLVNYHAPNNEAEQVKILEELNHIFDTFDNHEDTKYIWGADFNMILNTHLDADGGSPAIKIKSTAKLLSMTSDNDLCDIFHIRNPETRRYTWRRKTPFKQRRSDFFLVSDSIQENVQLVDIIPSVGSDHSAIKIILYSLRENSRGRSYWKFKSSLVEDKSFVESLKKEISDFVKQASTLQNPASRWEYLKFKCREYARNYSMRAAKMRKSRRIFLERKVAELEVLIASNSDDQVHKEYNQYKMEFETLYDYITAGLILRSKTSWYEHGEKSSKYFLNVEKHNKAKSHLRKIITDSNTEISDPSEIMRHIKHFYSALYKHRSTKSEKECLEYLNGLSLPKL